MIVLFSWQADVNAFGGLDGQTEFGPTFEFEYSARDAYGGSITEWGPNDPLNATWWHLVTEGPSHGGQSALYADIVLNSDGEELVAHPAVQPVPKQELDSDPRVHR